MSVLVRSVSFRRSRRRRRPSSLMADGALVRFALRQGTLQHIEKLFFGTQQRHIDLPLSDGQLPLHVAIDANRPEIVVYLLSHGAQVNKIDSAGWTALHHAVYNGNINLVKILLSHGADPNMTAGHLLPIDLAMDFDSNMMEVLREAATLSASKTMEAASMKDSEPMAPPKMRNQEVTDRIDDSDITRPVKDALVLLADTPSSRKGFAKRTASLLKRGAGSIRRGWAPRGAEKD